MILQNVLPVIIEKEAARKKTLRYAIDHDDKRKICRNFQRMVALQL